MSPRALRGAEKAPPVVELDRFSGPQTSFLSDVFVGTLDLRGLGLFVGAWALRDPHKVDWLMTRAAAHA